ncbi:sperm acrosome membrane-associated protein 4-like [Synchiropus picturatus]
MNRVILQVLAVGFCLALGQALQCYDCDLGLFKLCITGKVTCKAGEHCYSGVGEAAGVMDVTMKGCLKASECNKTTQVNFPGTSNNTLYSMTRTCCDTDLCNAAPGMPGGPMLPLAIATLATLLVTKILV